VIYKSKSSDDNTTAEDEDEIEITLQSKNGSWLSIRTDTTGFPSNRKLKTNKYQNLMKMQEDGS
jgi:hypothetical protein